MFYSIRASIKFLNSLSISPRVLVMPKCFSSENLDAKYTDMEKLKILEVINKNDDNLFSRYGVSKARFKKICQWKASNGDFKSISDIEYVDGFSEKSAKKLFSNILSEISNESKAVNKIKGQILYPPLNESVIKDTNLVLSLYISVNSICWSLIEKSSYEVIDWKYSLINYPEGKKLQISDILEIAWRITIRLPTADIYVMKAEPTTLRAGGSDPNNPKIISVNLQNAQLIAMIVALINARDVDGWKDPEKPEISLKQKVYFLRSSLPFRCYGTLVGNEKVSTEQTVSMLLKTFTKRSPDNSQAFISEYLQNMFLAQNDLEKDMLGHCLLMGLTFMDLCVYKNQERIAALLKKRME